MGKRLQKQKGFTLIEMMITISVLAILLGIGIYGYREAMIKAALRQETMSLESSLKMARAAARTRQETVTVALPLNVNSGTYMNYVDKNSNSVYDSGIDVLLDSSSLAGGVLISSATYTTFSYTSLGTVPTGNVIVLKRQDTVVPNQYRITVVPTGLDQVEISTDNGTSWSRAW